MVEHRWVYAAMRLTSIESSFYPFHVTFTAIVPGAYSGEARMCLRLIAETDTLAHDSHPSCFQYIFDISFILYSHVR